MLGVHVCMGVAGVVLIKLFGSGMRSTLHDQEGLYLGTKGSTGRHSDEWSTGR